ncbi:hypothetical protein [Amycolatopsis sp. DG1A-15b]|uniref:hypothetical protein n=1 Tax=Amycolatopsis sp. DG1A-15b TaxID=3052846 RepID=UPI00255B8393|nr:hypothetical protein [Amycolatopsis sp. DG1A-15b]WIX85640.1 hypothetical protein QRY02_31015 [Amycolatopsis sp. DG1A-15b]
MSFMRRAVRSAAVAAGIALTMAMALATPAEADANGSVLVGGGRASAAPAQPAGTAATAYWASVPANGRVNCFNYWGTFKQGTDVLVVDWATSSTNECFGIAPDRTIWHAWTGSGGWKVMPGNGRADYIYDVGENVANGARVVMVSVAGSTSLWCQYYYRDGGWTGSWPVC